MNTLKIFLTFALISFSLSDAMAQNTKGIHSMVIFEFKGNGIVKLDRHGETNFGEKDMPYRHQTSFGIVITAASLPNFFSVKKCERSADKKVLFSI